MAYRKLRESSHEAELLEKGIETIKNQLKENLIKNKSLQSENKNLKSQNDSLLLQISELKTSIQNLESQLKVKEEKITELLNVIKESDIDYYTKHYSTLSTSNNLSLQKPRE